MGTLKETVENLISTKKQIRTFSFNYQGEKFWVKQPELGEANIWHQILMILSKMVHNNFFKPTVVTDPKASLVHEAEKISFLREHGISVPEIMIASEDYLVLKDAGEPLSVLLNQDFISLDEKIEICHKLSAALADMHNRGFYHSRPALRDITYKEGIIYFMDFEESLTSTLTVKEAIIRDGFIFIHALYRKLYSPELISLTLENYHRSLRPDLWDALVTEGRHYHVTYFLLDKFKRHLGKDAVAIYQTLRYFKQF